MFEQIAELAHEIVVEIGAEVVHEPLRMVAEVVQFAVLIGIVWVVALGAGSRRGFVANMLAERQSRVDARLLSASTASKALQDSRREAASIARASRAKAREMITQAKKECTEIEETSRAETDAECSRIEERSESALQTEQQEMLLELREQLVDIVSSATRSIMNEKLTVAEQRTLIENTIVGSMSAAVDGDARMEAFAAGQVPKGA